MLWQPGSACYGYSHRAIGPRGARRSEDEMNEARPSDGGGCNLSRGGGSMGALRRVAARVRVASDDRRALASFFPRNSQAAQRRAPSTTHSPSKDERLSTGYRVVPVPRFARATRGRRGVVGFPPLRVSAGEGDHPKDGGGGAGRRSDALVVAIARNICRKTLKTLIQRPGPLPRPDPGSSPWMSKDASARSERPNAPIIFQYPRT